jgi:hypothetical protein
VRFIRTLVVGSGFVASLYTKVAQQHDPTSGNRTFAGLWSEHLTSIELVMTNQSEKC